jgi:hypothetical protein
VFLDPATYDFERIKLCIFNPGVRFRVWSGDRCVELLLCFHCDEFIFETYDSAGARLHGGCEDFEGRAPAELRALAREAFPDDPEILALK